jgi:ectoine hydroxylase-related dioxygenase (phytanoyl-CoA dioxygenase family)
VGVLTAAQKEAFRREGYVAVPGLVDAARVSAMRARIEWLCEHWESPEAERVGVGQEMDHGNTAAAERSAATVRKFSGLVPHEPVFREYATVSRLPDAAAELIGTPMGIYVDQALLKPPEIGSEKPFHQDNAYFGVEPDDAVITCWLALDDATPENGCMHYLPKSHLRGLVEHEKIENTPHLVPKGLRREDAVAVPAKAGTVVFHHGWTLHMSPPNTSGSWRRAMIVHYARCDAKTPKLKGAVERVR